MSSLMKQILFLALMVFGAMGTAKADDDYETLLSESFEDYTVGNHIASEATAASHNWWTTWENNPGTSEDGIIATYGTTTNKCGYFTWGNDQVLLLGDQESGIYDVEFDILVPTGGSGYFNILHDFKGSNSTWAMQVYLHIYHDGQNESSWPDHGSVHAGSNNTADLPCIYDEWMHLRLHVDIDNDLASFFYTLPNQEETRLCEWRWSLDSFGENTAGPKLAAIDFYPPNSSSVFYLDNISVKKQNIVSYTELSITPDEVCEALPEDEMTTVDITIGNTGNAIGNWTGWIDFGQGGEGTQTADLYYHNGEVSSGIGSSSACTREIGIRLPGNTYAGASMGMKIVSMKYYIYDDYRSSDNNYIFRIYGQGMYNQPGELLAEKTVKSTAYGQWITATFDEPVPMTGQTYWATVQLEQAASEYPLSIDGGEYGEEADGNWLSTNGGIFSHCYSAGSFGGAWLINVNCEGELIPATWATIDKNDGSVQAEKNEDIKLTLNSIGLNEGVYQAKLILNTSDPDLAHTEIPITMFIPFKNLNLAANGVTEDNVTNYWTTFYCGHTGYEIDDTENACAYTAEYDAENSQLTLHQLGTVIPKGNAVIIVGDDNEISMTASTAIVSTMPDNDLLGVDVRTLKSTLDHSDDKSGTFYVMGKVEDVFGFYPYTADYMPASKAYLLISGAVTKAPGLKMVFGETTNIKDFADYTDKAGAWYTLDGRKLLQKPATKGVYVNNGRKVVIK